jgi:acetylornithine deacetylase/succinyl-diaminopimelate desuccinylase-like protein
VESGAGGEEEDWIMVKRVFDYIDQNRDRFLEELKRLAAQPSISTENSGVEECAQLLRGMMEESGIKTTIMKTPGQPIVYGEAGPKDAPLTILIYGHYDVQPPEPLELWGSPPFEPTVKSDRLYGRGVADNKGQFYAHVKAVEACLRVHDKLPVRLKFLIEGEEEILSPSLGPWVRDNLERLQADMVYLADGPGHESLKPTMFFGSRGIVYLELKAKGAKIDCHSGNRGGVIPNPAWDLVKALGTMQGEEDRVLVKGFYDKVREPTTLEQEAVEKIPYDEGRILADLQITEIAGSKAYSFYEKLLLRPTLSIDGFRSGHIGKGIKTIIPSEALVKLDCRLVPDQDPHDIIQGIKDHLAAYGYGHVEVRVLTQVPPSRTPLDHPFAQKVIDSIELVHGVAPIVYPSSGGTIPAYVFTNIMGLPCFWVPYGQNDIQNHAPNENILLDFYYDGIKTTAALILSAAD